MAECDNNMVQLPQFNFYRSWSETFEVLKLWERGLLLSWLMWYAFDGLTPEEENNDPKLLAIFHTMAKAIDKQMDKYVEYLNSK